jgi:hypothetical protein
LSVYANMSNDLIVDVCQHDAGHVENGACQS